MMTMWWMVAGLSSNVISWLQSVLNATARLLFSLWKYDDVTPLLQLMHWLKMEQLI